MLTPLIRLQLIITCIYSLQAYSATYYISFSNGQDSFTGTSINSPWKTLEKVNEFNFSPGDSVLFHRSEIWRGQLLSQSGDNTANIYYGDYGTGLKPTILGSMSFNNPSNWEETTSNIWKCSSTFTTDIGNIIFNNSSTVGFKKWNLQHVENQHDFWYNLSSGELYLYSGSNPAKFYSSIELALRQHIINFQNTQFVTYENLNLKYGGAHGFGGGNTMNITIRSCDVSYIGGGDLNMDGSIRFGNGIEFWGNAINNNVEKCRLWEIYDTGLSNQNHTIAVTQQNIKYINNIVWNCGLASFELWNRPDTSITKDIYFENNTCLYAGYGWGNQRPDYHGSHVLIDDYPSQTDTVYIRNNIFHTAKRTIYAVKDDINGFINLDFNAIYQPSTTDSLFVAFPSFSTFKFDEFEAYQSALNKDVNSVFEDPAFNDLNEHDFTLSDSSPCINNGIITALKDDFFGNIRPQGHSLDMGAFEFIVPLSTYRESLGTNFSIYPNPTSSSFHINYYDQHLSPLHLAIYTPQGKHITTIHNYLPEKEIPINDLPSALYYIVLSNGEEILGTGIVEVIK